MSKKMANKILAAALSLGAVMNNGGIGSAIEKKEEKTSNSQNRDEILNYGLRYGKKGLNLLRENFGFKDIIGLLAFYKIHRNFLNYGKVPLGTLVEIVQKFDMEDSIKNFAACDAAQTLLKYYNNEFNRQFLLSTFIKEDAMKENNEEEKKEEEEKEKEVKLNAIKFENEEGPIKVKKPVKWAEQRASVLSFLFRNFKFEEICKYAGKNFISLLQDVVKNEKNYEVKDWKYCVSNAQKFLKFFENKKDAELEEAIKAKNKKQQELEKAQKEYEGLAKAIDELDKLLKGLENNEDNKNDIAEKNKVLEANKKKLEELKAKIEVLKKELDIKDE